MINDKNFSIAVLLSSYNGARYIEQQIESILSQELCGGELHLYVRDDGSSDATLDILDRLREDTRITVIKGENIGYIASFMSLIEELKNSGREYDFYSLADQDDDWDKDKLFHAINMIKKFDCPCLYQSVSRVVTEELEFIRDSEPCIRKITFFNTVIQTFSPGHTYVFNRALLEKVDSDLDCKRLYGHDAYLTNLAVLCGKVVFDNTSHANYRQHGKNQLGTSVNNGVIGWFRVRIKRVVKGDGGRYAKQIEYLYEKFYDLLSDDEKKEMVLFLEKRKNFFTRLSYVFKTKLYRQRRFENFLFRMLYLFGGYNT